MRIPQTIGIMFDSPIVGTDWPTVAEIDWSDWSVAMDVRGFADDDRVADWFAIAHDPNRDLYFDDDAEAMNVTNWDAIVAELSTEPTDYPRESAPMNAFDRGGYPIRSHPFWTRLETAIADALADGIVIVGKVLAVRPDMTTDLDALLRLRHRLADYPLLDEASYSERESAAFSEYLPTAWRDEIRQAPFGDETADALADVDPGDLATDLDHYSGFSGEYGPNLLEIAAARFAAILCAPEPTEPAPRFVAIVNIPGYLPMSDDADVFESIADAWAFLADERRRGEDMTDDADYSETVTELDTLAADGSEIGTVYGATPGYEGSHDLGLAYSVDIAEIGEDR